MEILQNPDNVEGWKAWVRLELTYDELATITQALGATNDEDHPDSFVIYRRLSSFWADQDTEETVS